MVGIGAVRKFKIFIATPIPPGLSAKILNPKSTLLAEPDNPSNFFEKLVHPNHLAIGVAIDKP